MMRVLLRRPRAARPWMRAGAAALALALAPVGAGGSEASQAGPAPFAEALERALAAPGLRGARLSALVVERASGRTLFAHHPERALVPASNLKLLTAVAALAAFGPSHRFTTEVRAPAPPDAEGAVDALYLRGGGDPALTSERWWRLAADLRLRGLRRVRGPLVVDDGRFDAERWHPSWGAVGSRAYHAPVGALAANYGAFRVVVEPGPGPGAPARVRVDPPVDYLRVASRARTVEPGTAARLRVDRRAAGEHERVAVTGTLPAGGGPRSFWRSVARPARYAGAVARMQLEANGIAVEGPVRRGRTPEEAVLLHAFEGAPLGEVARLFLKNSNNFVAESLVKSMGFREDGGAPGSWRTGIPAERRILRRLGLETDGLRLVDGSGLSYENRISARTLVEALRLADRSFGFGPELRAALPLAAADGTLEERADGAHGRLRAKTGLLTRVTGLSGFARTAEGTEAVFSILANGYRSGDEAAMRAVDGFAAALAQGAAPAASRAAAASAGGS